MNSSHANLCPNSQAVFCSCLLDSASYLDLPSLVAVAERGFNVHPTESPWKVRRHYVDGRDVVCVDERAFLDVW